MTSSSSGTKIRELI
jgi:hypothetical protein